MKLESFVNSGHMDFYYKGIEETDKEWRDKIKKVLKEIKKQDKKYRFINNTARNGAYDICIEKIEGLLKEN